jgi:hypothetical protein
MVRPTFIAATAFAAVLVLSSCSETPATTEPKAAEAKKQAPPEASAGQNAFYQMYKPAREWATDVMPLSLAGKDVEGVKSENGKFPMWTAVFVSPSKREARTFFYAVLDHGSEVHKGVTIGGAESWSGQTANSRPFQNSQFIVNSDAAYKAAAEKAKAWLDKNPDKKLAMVLTSTAHFSDPVWYLLWGDRTKSGYDIFIDATTGTPVK